MSKTVQGRLVYADLLRSAAILALIVLQVTLPALTAVSVHSASFTVLTVYHALSRWCGPVFVMLSGMFLLDPKRSLSAGRLLRHILRILTAVVLWGVLYALTRQLLSGGGLSWYQVRLTLLRVLHGGAQPSLRVLLLFVGLYLVTPVLRALVRGAGKKEYRWFFLLCFLFVSVFPLLLRLRPNLVISGFLEALDLHLVLGCVGYYVLGYYLKAYTLSRPAEFLIYLLGAFSAAVTVAGTLYHSRQAGQFSTLYLSWNSPNLVLFALAVCVLFRYVLGVSDERSRRSRLTGVSRVAFGIFLIQGLLLILLDRLGISALSFQPILAVPVLTAVIFLVSFGLAWLLSGIPAAGRFLT